MRGALQLLLQRRGAVLSGDVGCGGARERGKEARGETAKGAPSVGGAPSAARSASAPAQRPLAAAGSPRGVGGALARVASAGKQRRQAYETGARRRQPATRSRGRGEPQGRPARPDGAAPRVVAVAEDARRKSKQGPG